MKSENKLDLLSPDGLYFIHKICESHCLDKENTNDILDDWFEKDYKIFNGGSGGRVVCEFPDELLNSKYTTLNNKYRTDYVLKASEKPNFQNFIEISMWQEVYNSNSSILFSPIDIWDGAYRWLLMRRVTPISSVERDISYIMNNQEYIYESDIRNIIEERLNEKGYMIDDPEFNVGLYEPDDILCLFDYGGVKPRNKNIDEFLNMPNWIKELFDY